MGGGGIVQAKESLVTRAGSFMLSGSPFQLSDVLSAVFVACRHLLGSEL